MAWPLSQDYNEAVQNPRTSFSDPELRHGQVVINALGIPQPCSGNFADVYAVECAAGKTKWAVKCFTREVRGLRERYSAISSFLQQVNLPFTVDFQYLEQGIRIAGKWYPILKMHWVEGFTLNAFVRDNLDKPALLEGLSRIWLKMAARLREANLAHCDLQHGNVLLVPYTDRSLLIKLIDYDGMWVPALAQTPSGEVGHPAYQHPQRLRDGVYNREVDRFPLLSIHLALRALMVGGKQLWDRFDTGDNMLFRQQDFEAPARSPLFAELLRMKQAEVSALAGKLIDAARQPLDQVAHLTELVPVESPPPASHTTVVPRRKTNMVAPAASAAASAVVENAPADGRRGHERSKQGFGWMAAAAVAGITLVLGGVLIWAMSSKRPAEKNPNTPDQRQAQAKHKEPTKPPKEKKTPRPTEASKPDDPLAPPVKPKPDDAPPPTKPKPNDAPPPTKPKPNDAPPLTKPKPEEPVPPKTPKPDDTPAKPVASEGFKLLFNGKDLTGWKMFNNGAATWKVSDSVLIGEGPEGHNHLFTERGDYENFHLRMETKISDRGAGGIFFRARPASGLPDGYAVQINSNRFPFDRTGSLFVGFSKPGEVREYGNVRLAEVKEELTHPNTWFALEVIAEANFITVKIDGKTVIDHKEGDKRFTKGHIALLASRPPSKGSVIQFRKIRIEELPATVQPDKPPVVARLPEPDEAVQKKATEDIRDIYQDDYKNAQPDDLSRKLLKRGQNNQEEPGRRFVYLREARDLAAQAGDFALCFRVIDEMTRAFAVETMAMKVDAVQNTSGTARTLSANKALLETALALFAETVQADDYETAERLAKAAEVAAGKTGIPARVIHPYAAVAKRLQAKYADVKLAVARLAQDPKDAEANRIVGSFRCFEKGEWERGLPLLALGDNPKLKELAAKDRAAPQSAETREAVGSGWWMLAKQHKGIAKAIIQQRACYWYGLVLPDAAVKTRERLENGFRLHNKEFPGAAWGHLDISQATRGPVGLRLPKPDKGIATHTTYSGPIEMTVLARTEKNNIRLYAGKGACVIFNWENKPEELRVCRPDGTDRPESGSLATAAVKPLQPNLWYLLTWRITEEGMTVSVNGRLVFSEEHKNNLSEKHPISVHSADSDIEVLSFTVRQIGKKSG